MPRAICTPIRLEVRPVLRLQRDHGLRERPPRRRRRPSASPGATRGATSDPLPSVLPPDPPPEQR
eukprot:4277896-Pyramimonas_sp.AAC.1